MQGEGKGERFEQPLLRAERLLERGDGAIEIAVVAAILYARAGVADARAVTRQCASAGREARAESNMIEIEGEMARVGDLRAAAARPAQLAGGDSAGRRSRGDAERGSGEWGVSSAAHTLSPLRMSWLTALTPPTLA